jgi:hypothetical protein
MVLLPATMELLDDRNWWLPGWLDRLLPNIHVEGHEVTDAEFDLRDAIGRQRGPRGRPDPDRGSRPGSTGFIGSRREILVNQRTVACRPSSSGCTPIRRETGRTFDAGGAHGGHRAACGAFRR